jgi:hypothetical protein
VAATTLVLSISSILKRRKQKNREKNLLWWSLVKRGVSGKFACGRHRLSAMSDWIKLLLQLLNDLLMYNNDIG